MNIFRTLFLFFLLPILCFAQAEKYCYHYRFERGDSLVYRVESQDSIVFKGVSPQRKDRVETLVLVCDSVGLNGHFYMRQTMTKFVAKEWETAGKSNPTLHANSPWIGRCVYLEIDSLGRRYSSGIDDTTKYAIAPGGAFAPLLLPQIADSCLNVGKTSLINQTIDLVECSFPPAGKKSGILFHSEADIDTLGEHCKQFRFSLSGQGALLTKDQEKDKIIRMTSVMNEFGRMRISTKTFVPVHYFGTTEIKLSIKTSDMKEVKVKHMIKSNFTLESLTRNSLDDKKSIQNPKKIRRSAGK